MSKNYSFNKLSFRLIVCLFFIFVSIPYSLGLCATEFPSRLSSLPSDDDYVTMRDLRELNYLIQKVSDANDKITVLEKQIDEILNRKRNKSSVVTCGISQLKECKEKDYGATFDSMRHKLAEANSKIRDLENSLDLLNRTIDKELIFNSLAEFSQDWNIINRYNLILTVSFRKATFKKFALNDYPDGNARLRVQLLSQDNKNVVYENSFLISSLINLDDIDPSLASSENIDEYYMLSESLIENSFIYYCIEDRQLHIGIGNIIDNNLIYLSSTEEKQLREIYRFFHSDLIELHKLLND